MTSEATTATANGPPPPESCTPAFAKVKRKRPKSTGILMACSNACNVGIWFGLVLGAFDGRKGTTKTRASAGCKRAFERPIQLGMPASIIYHAQCCNRTITRRKSVMSVAPTQTRRYAHSVG